MQITLREGYFDALLLEAIPDFEQHRAADIGHSLTGITDPKAKLKIDRAVSKTEKQAFRRGVLQDTGQG